MFWLYLQNVRKSWPCVTISGATTVVRVTITYTTARAFCFYPCPLRSILYIPIRMIPLKYKSERFSSVQSLSRVWLFVTPWTTACQASLSVINSWSLLKLMPIELVMPSDHLILCHPLLLLPSIFPSIRVFSNESALRIRWPKYWSFSINISPSSEHPGLISFRWDWLDLLVVREIMSVQIPPVTFPSQRPWAEMVASEWKPIPYKPLHHLLTLTTLTPDTLESLFLKYTKQSVSSGLFMLFLLVDLHGSLFTSFRSLCKSPLLSEPFLSKI